MLAVRPLRDPSAGDERDDWTTTTTGSFPGLAAAADEASLLDDFSFSDLFMGIDDGDVLPDLELDPADIFADISSGFDAAGSGEEDSAATAAVLEQDAAVAEQVEKEDVSSAASAASAATPSEARSASPDDGEKGRKSSTAAEEAAAKGSQGKRKAKVDWTPELHRRFVQAVEQLGIDKAVPSRILELMGIDCLTRHNIASHLQKYRSHRKHLLARDAEATSWNQRRQMYAAKRADVDANQWLAGGLAIGFLPPPPTPQPAVLRPPPPLHVWGHPPAEAPLPHMWPPQPPWPQAPPLPLPPPHDPSLWQHHYQIRGSGGEGWISHAMIKGAPFFSPAAFARPSIVPGIVPHHPIAAMFRPVPSPTMTKNCSSSQLQFDAHPSKESIDAAIGDVIERPWLPLPLGLKPPSLDSVLVELQKQGVSKVP